MPWGGVVGWFVSSGIHSFTFKKCHYSIIGICTGSRLISKPLNSRSLGITSLRPTSNDLCRGNSILCDTNIISVLNTIPSTVKIIKQN